jgi:aspartyl protease family protein
MARPHTLQAGHFLKFITYRAHSRLIVKVDKEAAAQTGTKNMQRFLLVAAVAALSAVYFAHSRDGADNAALATTGAAQPAPQEPMATPVALDLPGQTSIAVSGNGHFMADFKVNGRAVSGMVDTGATFVAINEQTARQIGVSLSDLNYRYAVTTANGTTQAAHVTLDRMELGSVRVRGVDAYVLKDKSLTGMLVGMSFMGKLKSYKVEDGVLYLKN